MIFYAGCAGGILDEGERAMSLLHNPMQRQECMPNDGYIATGWVGLDG